MSERECGERGEERERHSGGFGSIAGTRSKIGGIFNSIRSGLRHWKYSPCATPGKKARTTQRKAETYSRAPSATASCTSITAMINEIITADEVDQVANNEHLEHCIKSSSRYRIIESRRRLPGRKP